MKDHNNHHQGHPHGARPSVMEGRFREMAQNNPDLFVIKRLKVPYSKSEGHGPAIRTPIHTFIFLTAGETLVNVGDKSYLFKANECAVIPAGQVFSVLYYRDCIGFMGGFHTGFLNSDMEGKSLLRSFGFLRKWGDHKVLFDEDHAGYVTKIFERLLKESETTNNKDIIKAYLTTLLVELEDAYTRTADPANHLSTDNALCNQFVEYIFTHPDQSVPVSEHALRLNVSVTHLQKTVKRLTGKSPLSWISEAVILETKVLLAHTELPISEIASRVGINDPSYFSRLFKKHVGMTPALYRANIR